MQQKSKSKSKESQLPLKSEGSNEGKGFRGNCDSQGKLGMCPSLAELDSGGIPRTSRRQRNPCAMLLTHGASGEKSDSFSRWGEQDRSALWNLNQKHVSCNCSGGTVTMKYYFIENPAPRENDFQRPAKGGSTPAFACQRATIAPLPCPNLQLVS